VRGILGAAVGVLSLVAAACASSSTPATDVDAEAPDASMASDGATSDAPRGAETSPVEASVTEIVLSASSFSITDGGVLECGPDYDGVDVFYAAGSNPMPAETGLVSCAAPVVISPVEPGIAYQLDVYLQKGGHVVAQATCTAMTQSDQAVAPTCPQFM
jgi:hypothetical protein